MRLDRVCGIVLGLVLWVGGTAFGQGEEGEEDGFPQRILEEIVRRRLEEVVTKAGSADQEQVFKKFVEDLAQQLGPEHTITVRVATKLAVGLYQNGYYGGAQDLYEGVLATLIKTRGEEHPYTLRCKVNLALMIKEQGDLNRAREIYKEALETLSRVRGKDHPDTLISKNGLADTFLQLGDFNRARAMSEDALATLSRVRGEDHPDTLTSKLTLANTLHAQGDFTQSRVMYKEIHATFKRVLGKTHPDTLVLEGILAAVFAEQGDLNRARAMYEDVLATLSQVRGEDHPSTLRMKKNLASIISQQGDFNHAQQIGEEVLLTLSRVLGEDHPSTLTAKVNLANTLKVQGDLNRARGMEEEILATYSRVLGEDHPSTLASKANLANTLKAQGDFNQARGLEEKILATTSRVLGKAHPITLKAMHNLASTMHSQRELDGARHILEKILKIRREDRDLETAEKIENISLLADIYRAQGKPELAADLFLQALGALEVQVKKAGDSEDLKSVFKSGYEHLYFQTLATLLKISRKADAHHILERFRAQAFLNMLSKRNINFIEIPPDIANLFHQLAAQYDATIRLRDKLHATRNKDAFDNLLKKQRDLRRERERLDAEFRVHSPEGTVLEPLKVDEIRQKLEPGTLMLSYIVGPEQTYLFTLTRNSVVAVYEIEAGEAKLWGQYQRFFAQLQGATSSQLGAGRSEMACWLYKKLIGPVAEQVARSERLVIIPDGPLHYIPFAALVQSDGKYLIETIPVHSAASATVYVHLLQQRPPSEQLHGQSPLQIAAFGNPSYPQGQAQPDATIRSAIDRGIFNGGLQPLPFTEREVTEIGKLYPEASARTFLGSTATEENATTIGKNARILHIAAHGVTDRFTPLDSFVALTVPDVNQEPSTSGETEEKEKEQENGLLQAWEILERVRLDADLVVLSACRSSFGPEVDGDGLQSLSRAFQIAGARTVVASLWNVNDASTAELMIRFYRHLDKGKPKDEAMQAAQLEFIRGSVEFEVDGEIVERDYASPYYWAAFQVIGDWK